MAHLLDALAAMRQTDVDLILCTGGMSVDPDDNTPGAIRASGAQIVTYGAPVLKCLKKAVPEAFYDVHLMISDPARYAQDFAAAGANLINFHIEAVPNHVGQTIAAVRETGCLVGLTISPSTPPQAVFPYLDELDLVLVMGVEPGFGGQKFIPTTVSRVAAIKAECNRRGVSPRIEVDGGINTETASLCAQAGASVLVMGSAFFKAQDRTALAKQVRAL